MMNIIMLSISLIQCPPVPQLAGAQSGCYLYRPRSQLAKVPAGLTVGAPKSWGKPPWILGFP